MNANLIALVVEPNRTQADDMSSLIHLRSKLSELGCKASVTRCDGRSNPRGKQRYKVWGFTNGNCTRSGSLMGNVDVCHVAMCLVGWTNRKTKATINKAGQVTVLPGRRVKGSPKWCVGELAAGRIELRIEGAGDLQSWRGHGRAGDERFLVTDFYSGDFVAWWTLGHKEAFDMLMEHAASAAKGKEAA